MGNDFRRLKKEADISRVVEFCGIQTGRKIGNAQFVICPNPQHDDHHPTNAYYRDGWNTIYCTTCGKNMGAIDVIMWTTGMNYGEAADALWELEGEPDWYYESRQKKEEREKRFFISQSELATLGLKAPGVINMPVGFSDYKQRNGNICQPTWDGYLLVKQERVDWTDFISPEDMAKLVLRQARIRFSQYEFIENRLRMPGLLDEEREKVRKLVVRARERGHIK